jgi:hypothetical protein
MASRRAYRRGNEAAAQTCEPLLARTTAIGASAMMEDGRAVLMLDHGTDRSTFSTRRKRQHHGWGEANSHRTRFQRSCSWMIPRSFETWFLRC